MKPEDILTTYETHARGYDKSRGKHLFERKWLDRFVRVAPNGRRLLDLGCGSGRPIAQYLSERNMTVTGVDGAAAMIEMFRENLPRATAHHADMRGLDLAQKFDAILAWNSFFHLTADDQRAMFPVFAAHADAGAALMFTSGPDAGEAVGKVQGDTVFHASLAPDEYRRLLAENGFDLVKFTPEDPECNFHTVWLARKSA